MHKTTIIGAGAVGSLLAALLCRAGKQVFLVGKKEHVDSINANGLTVHGVQSSFTERIHATLRPHHSSDLVICAVKLHDLEATCKEIAPWIGHTPLLLLQNGLHCDEIAFHITRAETILSGVVLFNAQYVKPGQITFGAQGPILLGNARTTKDSAILAEVKALLESAVPVQIVNNIAAVRATKLILNIMNNSIDGLTGLPLNICMRHPLLRKIDIMLIREALAVYSAGKVACLDLPGFKIDAIKKLVRWPLPIASLLLYVRMKKILKSCILSSTVQSLKRGKPTEVDYLNGEIVALGKQYNSKTPYNTAVVELIHTIEKTGSFYTPEKIAAACRLKIIA